MTTPDPAMGERARALVDGVAEQVWPTDLSTRAQTLLVVAIAAFAAEEAETQTRGQLAATERATETAGQWFRAYQDTYGTLQMTEASEARLREAARMMIAEAEGDVTGEYSSPGIRLLRAALEEPTG